MGSDALSLLGLITHNVGSHILANCDPTTKRSLREVSKLMRAQVDVRTKSASWDDDQWDHGLIDKEVDDLEASALRHLPQLPQLTRLSMTTMQLTPEAAALVARGGASAGALFTPVPAFCTFLQELDLFVYDLTADNLATLLGVQWQLECLKLCCPLGEPGARLLARAAQQRRLPRLRRLRLGSCGIDAPALKQLAQADWSQLTELDLSSNWLPGEDGEHPKAACAFAVGALAASLGPAMRRLNFVHLGLSAEDVTALAQHQRQLAGLRDLDLAANDEQTSHSIIAVASAGRALEKLGVVLTPNLTAEAAAALAAVPSLKSLYISVSTSYDHSPSAPFVKNLSSVQWHRLEVLKVGAMPPFSSALRAASFPRVSKLICSRGCAAVFAALVSAGWPAAQSLRELVVLTHASGTDLEAFAAIEWPSLWAVRLTDKTISELAGMRARFPWLERVAVSRVGREYYPPMPWPK